VSVVGRIKKEDSPLIEAEGGRGASPRAKDENSNLARTVLPVHSGKGRPFVFGNIGKKHLTRLSIRAEPIYPPPLIPLDGFR
jgi:hypothetical protein